VIHRILVATDRSDTATRAVEWAAEMSGKYAADLLVLQVVPPEHLTGQEGDEAIQAAADDLAALTRQVCGERGRPQLVYDSDPADVIVRTCEQERVDLVVVGNVGMRDRTEFLLGSVPNRVSHNARCSVVIVNTAMGDGPDGTARHLTAQAGAEPTEGQLLGRAAHVARVLARYGLGDVLTGTRDDGAARARRFRSALEELGPTFAKLGQILSTRPDLLPPAVVAELSGLQDHVNPLTEPDVVAVMEEELKVPWEDVFASIEPDPLASGTIAQVHRATRRRGRACPRARPELPPAGDPQRAHVAGCHRARVAHPPGAPLRRRTRPSGRPVGARTRLAALRPSRPGTGRPLASSEQCSADGTECQPRVR
jgi:ubiquinone biosynthesis protein